MNPATDLDDVVYLFDPAQPLTKAEMDFYVDRGSDARSALRTILLANDLKRQHPAKILFTGHKGSGKTTEINRLCDELEDKFFIVRIDFRKRPDVQHVDILVKAAMSLFKAASDEEIIKRAPAQIAQGLWEKISGFVEKKIFGEVHVRPELLQNKELTTKINLLGIEFESKFEREADSREKIRSANEQQLSELISNIDDLAAAVRINYGKPVLFIFEDLDKLDLEAARRVFYEHGPTLNEIKASAIFTMPIGLRYAPQFATVRDYFNGQSHCMHNFTLQKRNGAEDERGMALLESVITRRMDRDLITDEALASVIAASGGLIRTLIALIRNAAVSALGRSAERIEHRDVQRAIGKLRGDFIAMLRSEHYPVLKARHQDKELTSDAIIQELLESLALLEYEESAEERDDYTIGDCWCDVHPIVWPLVEERTENG